MNIRFQIKSALFSLISTAVFDIPVNGFSTWNLTGRRLKLWTAVPKESQPAMFLVQHRETYQEYGAGQLRRRYLDLGAWCYAPTGDPAAGDNTIIGDDLLDAMEIAIENALVPDDTERNELTLNGLCYWARIDRTNGLHIRDPGDIDGQAFLCLPIRVLLP
jgi:hypothetical protein